MVGAPSGCSPASRRHVPVGDISTVTADWLQPKSTPFYFMGGQPKQEWTAIQDLPRSFFFGFPLSRLFVSLFPGFSIRVGNFRTLMSPKKVTDAARGF